MDTRPEGASGPSLLLELEPAHRVFLRNLEDTLLSRTPAPAPTTSRPGRFWNDVFVSTGLPWSAFLESFLWHLAVISVVLAISHVLALQESRLQPRFSRQSYIVYPTPSYPAVGSGGPRVRPKPRHETVRQQALRVKRQQQPDALRPPNIKQAQSTLPRMGTSRPATPLFAPKLSQLSVPAVPNSAVPPAPDLRQVAGRHSSLSGSAALPPSPSIASVSERRAHASDVPVVAPPPNPQGLLGSPRAAAMAHAQVVAPPPELLNSGQRTPRAGAGFSSANLVVPPSPSQANATALARRGSMAGSGVQVAPPAPAVSGVGAVAKGGKISSLTGGLPVVPPAPSVVIGGTGNSARNPRQGSLTGGGSQVVPPASAIGGGINSRGSQRLGELAAGTQVVPPPPNLGGGLTAASGNGSRGFAGNVPVVAPAPSAGNVGNSAGARTSSLSGLPAQAVAPSPELAGGGGSVASRGGNSLSTGGSQVAPPADSGSSAGDRSVSMNTGQAVAPASNLNKVSDPPTIELPVRVIGLAVALPNTSYFSNYEVFIAERRKSKTETELIKLVYVSLPYQRRLSDYGFDNSKVYKLRVTRDKTCDETLLQMTWPTTDENHSGSRYATGPPALGPGDANNLLPCYRTTADDYIRAVTGR